MTQTQRRPSSRQRAVQLVDLTMKAARAYDRADLHKRLRMTRQRVADPTIRVLVVGEFKQGKSSLVNGLVLASICPVDDDIATATPTVVRYGEEPKAVAIYEPADDSDEPQVEDMPFDQIAEYVTEIRRLEGAERRLDMVEVEVPSPLLRSGLTLVDTPGVGGLGSPYTAVTIGALPLADAVVFVTDASQEFTKPEIDFLNTAREMCPNLICVMTKRDLYPQWREIFDRNKNHLKSVGVRAVLIPISSSLHQQAVDTNSDELQEESGYPLLVDHLRKTVVTRAERLIDQAVVADMSSVVAQLGSQFEAERQALVDPERGQRLVEELATAKERADSLRGKAAKWQQTLNDGITDLSADIDFDLRSRIRTLSREAEDAVENTDPADAWDEFETWLRQRVTQTVAENYAMLHRGAETVSNEVAEHFLEDEALLHRALQVEAPGATVDALDVAKRDDENWGAGAKALHGMRSSYGGVLMFGMLGGLAGLALINPATVAIGVIMGRKAIKDEKKRRLTMRQSQAKNSLRRYMDDALFQVSTDSRNALRKIQRQLRDYYSDRADELQRSTAEALQTAQEAVKKDAGERQSRLRDVDAELERIRALRANVTDFAQRTSQAGETAAARPTQGSGAEGPK